MTDRIPVLRGLVLLLVVGFLLAACSDDQGPNLVAAINSVPGSTGPPQAATSGPDPLEGADRRFYFNGEAPTAVARHIRDEAGDPTESITEDGVIHHLYRSGTVIVADVAGRTGVGLFDNDRARRSRPVLRNSSSWTSSVNSFRSSSGGSGNGFRGGGSGFGK